MLVIWNEDKTSHGTIFTATHALKSGKRVFVITATGDQIDHCIGEIYDETIFTAADYDVKRS